MDWQTERKADTIGLDTTKVPSKMEMVKLSFDKDLRDAATNVSSFGWRMSMHWAQTDEIVDDTIERRWCRARCSGMCTFLTSSNQEKSLLLYLLLFEVQADEIANAGDVHKDEVSGRRSVQSEARRFRCQIRDHGFLSRWTYAYQYLGTVDGFFCSES